MRRAFDGTEIQQQQQLKTGYSQQQQQAKILPQAQMNRIRPSSAKPPMYNGFVGSQNGSGNPNESVDDQVSMALTSDHVTQSTHAFYPATNNSSQRQFSSGMQRNHSGHRSYENNIQTINRTAQQINKINQSMNNSGLEAYGGEIQKHMPRVITLEKEHLYAEALKFKNRVNELHEENTKLKTKLFQAEKEITKQKKIIDSTQGMGAKAGGQFVAKFEGHITENLKNVVKDLKSQLAARDDECNKVKKALKYTRIQELEIERKSYSEECTRLKAHLHQALSEKMEVLIKEADYQKLEERFIVLSREVEQLRYDNTDMAQQLKDFSTQNAYLNQNLADQEKKANMQAANLRANIRDREKDIQELKTTLGRVKATNIQSPASATVSGPTSNRITRPTSAKTTNNTQATENGFLKKQIEMKDAKIKELDEIVKQLRQSQQNQTGNASAGSTAAAAAVGTPTSSNSATNATSNHTNNASASSASQNQVRQQQQPASELDPIDEADEAKKQDSNSKPQSSPQKQQQDQDQEQDQEAMDAAAQEELLRIGEEVQYKLRAHGMTMEDAAELLFESFEASTSLVDLRAMFLEPPFYLSEESSVVLARYLIEEAKVELLQQEQQPIPEQLELDWNSLGKNEYIFQILGELIGAYNVFSKAYAQTLYDSLLQIFEKQRANIESAFASRANGENSISKEEFVGAFDALNIKLESDQLSFLIMAMILKSPSINELNYQNLLQLFSNREEQNNGGIYEEDEDREEDNDEQNQYEVDNEFSQSTKPQQQQQQVVVDEVEDEYADDFNNDSQLKKSDKHKKKSQQQSSSQQGGTSNAARLQRPQSSKRRAPQTNNQENGGVDGYEFDNEQIIDEDDASEEEARPPAAKPKETKKKKKTSTKRKPADPKQLAPAEDEYANDDFEAFD